jgi:hypothetical protein
MFAKKAYRLGLLALALPIFAVQASADVTFDLNMVVTGDTPVGDDPWARVTIEDIGANMVRITGYNLTDEEDGQFITDFFLNIDPFVNDLVASNFVNGAKFNPDDTAYFGEDSFGTAGYNFDLRFSFDTTNSGGGEFRLNPGQSAGFDLTGTGLSSASFLAFAGKTGEQEFNLYALAHVQGIPGDGEGSSKIGAVPEPATMSVLALGAAALLRRRKKS